MAKKKSKKSSIKVDFKGVESRVLLPEGQYLTKVVSVEKKKGSDYPYLEWTFETINKKKKFNGKPLYTNTSLAPKALWNLRNLLESLGEEVPDSTYDLDLSSLEGKQVVLIVNHEDYEGRPVPKVQGYISAEDDSDEDEDSDDEDDSDEDEDSDDEDEAEVEDDEDEDSDDEDSDDEDEDEDDEDEDDEDEDEDDDEDDSLSEDQVMEMSTKELEKLVKTHKLKVKLDDIKSTRKKRRTVIQALKDKDIL